MNTLKRIVLGLAMFTVAFAANAQSLDTNANSSAGSSSGAQSQLSLVQNSSGKVEYGGHFSQTQNAQVPISVVGYSSFSQANCNSSIGGGATTRMFSMVYNGPSADINCQHIVMGDAFGRATQLAMQAKVPAMARASLSLVFFSYCTADEELKTACIEMGLVTPTGKVAIVGGGLFHRGTRVVEVSPAKVLPDGAEQMLGAISSQIPSRPPGWTGVAQGPAPVAMVNGDVVPSPQSAIAGTYQSMTSN